MIHRFLKSYQADFTLALQELDLDQVSRVVEVLYQAYRKQRKIMIVGNGGSAATASHFVCDLSKTAMASGVPAVRAISLNDNIPLITAYGNDLGYEHIFSEQVAILAEPGDVLICISGSGNSPNILKAYATAKEKEMTTVGLLGFGGGQAMALCDQAVVLPSSLYGPVEDLHLFIAHAISDCFRQLLLFHSQPDNVNRPGVWSVAAN